jgi:hypothetical protein
MDYRALTAFRASLLEVNENLHDPELQKQQ